ncbi:hypothetical protein KM800_06160 [Clostridium tyrobutyricum]|uniref:hypothetical protein n=1 Tax=Clostridium tyrobutyricum TaxID=1519 RepID=UPI001C38681C|nr:hypothetical protein [Clostridium tyrobutyricum]MBV4418919.1 hypothetical protein [Clostridium tyrobutyricum]
MINIIKTAIITIVISFISGLLLDYYKNLAPRLLCNVGNGIPLKVNGEKFYAYIITIKNTSKKIIHQLNIDIQSSQDNLKARDAKITKGLKFDSSVKNTSLDVYIPFLSRGDKFSVTLYVKNQYTTHNQPVIAIRSPENFKKVDSSGQKGFLSSLLNIPESIGNLVSRTSKENEAVTPDKKGETFYRNNAGKTKKILISIVSIVLVVLIGILTKYYLSGTPDNTPTSNTTTSVPTQSNDTTGSSSGQKTKNTDTNTSKYRKNNSTNTSNTGSNEGNTSKKDSTSTSNTNTSTDGTNSKSSSGTNSSNTNKTTNSDSNTSNSGTDSDKSTNSNTSTDGTNSNTNTNTSTDGTSSNSNTSTSGSNQNANTSTGQTNSNTNK